MGNHVVPQRYLKGFQTKARPSFIWMYDKKVNTSKLLPIKQVAQVPGFYADDVEAALNTEAEIPGNDVIDKIRRGEDLEEIDRRHLTYYIGTMIARVPAARARATTYIPAALDNVTQAAKKAIKDAARAGVIDEGTMTARLAEAEAVNARFQKQPPAQVTKVIETPWPFESWLVTIYSMTWRVLQSDGPSYFLTSDNPIALLNGEGLGHPGCELTFPLSKELMLHCSWQGDHEFERLPAWPQFVKECNRRTAFWARRFVFYHEEAPWVLELARNKAPQQNRLNWG
jgi:hypothetical protein